MESVIAICLGIGLAASCGFRVFVPMLVISVVSKTTGWLTLSEGFEWLSTWPAIIALSVATVLEIGAYYLPWLDNLLDSVSGPAAVVAGVITSAACITDVDPLLKWTLAVIAGGGVAGTVKLGTTGLRLASSVTTGGMANPVISTVEWIASLVLSVVAILLPILAAVVALVLVVFLVRFAVRFVTGYFKQPAVSETD